MNLFTGNITAEIEWLKKVWIAKLFGVSFGKWFIGFIRFDKSESKKKVEG